MAFQSDQKYPDDFSYEDTFSQEQTQMHTYGGMLRSFGIARILMFGLIVLAISASIIMLFTDSHLWLKIAIIAALWAAFIGALLATKAFSALTVEQERSDALQQAHDAELAQEKSLHQQREAQLESEYARRLDSERDTHLEQLRAELTHMRRQLAQLSGVDFPDFEHHAVRASAERIHELETGVSLASDLPADQTTVGTDASSVTDSQVDAHDDIDFDTFAMDDLGFDDYQDDSFASQQSQYGSHDDHDHRPAESFPADNNAWNAEQLPADDRQADEVSFSTGTFASVNWGGDDSHDSVQVPLVVDTSAMDAAAARPSAHQAGEAKTGQADDASTRQHHSTHRRAESSDDSRERLTVADLMQRFHQ